VVEGCAAYRVRRPPPAKIPRSNRFQLTAGLRPKEDIEAAAPGIGPPTWHCDDCRPRSRSDIRRVRWPRPLAVSIDLGAFIQLALFDLIWRADLSSKIAHLHFVAAE
jgi:hypothetical protein